MLTGARAVVRGVCLFAALLLVGAGGRAATAGGLGARSREGTKAAPAFSSAPLTNAVVRQTYTYHVTTTDPDAGDTRTVTAVSKPSWLRLRRTAAGDAILQGRPGAGQLGTHAVRLAVSDAAGATAVQEFTLVVRLPAGAAPEFSPAAESALTAPLSVTLAVATPGATIRYTTDGTVPTADNGIPYTGPLRVSADVTLTAVACLPGHADSAPTVATYSFLALAVVETLGLTAAGDGEATLAGTVNPLGPPATAWFEWSRDPASDLWEQTPHVNLPPGMGTVPISATLSDLAPGTAYYYRAVVQNADGTARGEVDSLMLEPISPWRLVVNTTADTLTPPPGKTTLRAAVARVPSGGTISFDPLLNARQIDLTIVGEPASVLKGEVFTMNAGHWDFMGFQPRNYGKSALYAAKSLTLDATALPDGIVLNWAGGEAEHARVLAVYGNLILRRVTISSGSVVAEAIPDNPSQPFTLARGGGLAVWGVAVLEHCVLAGNRARGDTSASRDRGCFGGAAYGDSILLRDCIVSGNTVSGFGGAGGGIYSVGGVESWVGSTVERSTVSGNRVTAQHAYGGGVYSDGGGPGRAMTLAISDSTIARNLVEDHPDIAQSAMFQYYCRGGGIYMSNGKLQVSGSTIVENAVTGQPWRFGGKPNLGGGGIAATIGNAHVVESMEIWHSIIAGNLLSGGPNDLFTGSLVEFYSYGYNLVGTLDFSEMLVSIPAWDYLSRRHWPKVGDRENVSLPKLLNVESAPQHGAIVSAGPDAGSLAVLWYPPRDRTVNRIPAQNYDITVVRAGYTLVPADAEDDFLNLILQKLRLDYGGSLAADLEATFGDMGGVVWGGEAVTWPSDPQNVPWIAFWHDLDTVIGDRLGAVRLGDDFWGTLSAGPFGEHVVVTVNPALVGPIERSATDQLGASRLLERWGSIGAVVRQR